MSAEENKPLTCSIGYCRNSIDVERECQNAVDKWPKVKDREDMKKMLTYVKSNRHFFYNTDTVAGHSGKGPYSFEIVILRAM